MVWLLALTLAGPAGSTSAMHADYDPALVVAGSPVLTAAAILASETRRTRSMERRIMRLLSDGARRSTTFAAIVTAVQKTDVVVYIETRYRLPSKTAGRLLLQGVAGGQRYLRVQIRPNMPDDQTIAIIAHELRHALEVAAEASVVDQAGLASLYQRIGYPSSEVRGYDTEAARRAGDRVHAELRG